MKVACHLLLGMREEEQVQNNGDPQQGVEAFVRDLLRGKVDSKIRTTK